jgi:ubiquitin-protein ligase E3 C
VTSSNKLRYVYQMANYRLNTKIKKQCDAFLKGMRDVVPVVWLRMFSERELQWLISGSDAPVDVADLRANCVYTGKNFVSSVIIDPIFFFFFFLIFID